MSNAKIEDDAWMEAGLADDGEGEEADAEFIGGRVAVRGEIVSKVRMGAILGIARMTMDRLVKDGAPVIERGDAAHTWKLNTASVIKWLRDRDVARVTGNPDAANLDVAKLRDKAAQARLRELQIAEREGELVEAAQVTEWIKRRFGEIRSRVQAVESQLMTLTDEQRDELRAAIHDALAEISGEQASNWNDEPITSASDEEDASEV